MTDSPLTPRSTASAILDGLAGVRGWEEEFYRELHAQPELSHQEAVTSSKVAARLGAAGYDVRDHVEGTGVVGVLRNGDGPAVLLRADMDALPVEEATGLPYASTVVATELGGGEVPVMHACGHDVHVTCLLGAAQLMAEGREHWHGTLVVLFQPAEETGDGAMGMVSDGLRSIVPEVDVAMAQHVLPAPAGLVGTVAGPVLSAADSVRVTVFGRGAHGSMPQASVDPVVLAAMIVIRLQTIVSRETRPGEPVVVTVGSVMAGTKSNVIPDHAVIELNVRTYDEQVREATLSAIRRIVNAECEASGAPQPATFELFDRFPLTDNDPAVTDRVSAAFAEFFGDRARPLPMQTASEDFSDIPNALGVPYTYWGIGGIDPDAYRVAQDAGRVAHDIPVNHSASFAPVIQPPSTREPRRSSLQRSRGWARPTVPRTRRRLGTASTLLIVLDLTGTAVFGLNGALTAMEAEQLDIVGVAVLGTMTALGGGIVRDILSGALPPATFSDWRYLAVALTSAAVAFLARPYLNRVAGSINVLDAAGLSLFCVTGTAVANAHGLGPFQSAILGAITGVGGGTIRDVVIRRVPTVLTSGLYAVPALVGATITAVALHYDFYGIAVALPAALACFTIRLAGLRFHLNVPAARPPGDQQP